MVKVRFEAQIPVTIFQEGKYFIAYTPALDLSTSAGSHSEARKRFGEVVRIFINELAEKGTLDKVLSGLGWRKVEKQWMPPFITHESANIKIPLTN